MEFIQKICVCYEYFMQPDDIIKYGYLVQESMREYLKIVDSKKW